MIIKVDSNQLSLGLYVFSEGFELIFKANRIFWTTMFSVSYSHFSSLFFYIFFGLDRFSLNFQVSFSYPILFFVSYSTEFTTNHRFPLR